MKRNVYSFASMLILIIILCVASYGTAFASARQSGRQVTPEVNISGYWHFTTDDSLYHSFYLTLKQVGAKLYGHDKSGERVTGSVHGNMMKFHLHTQDSEDDFWGNGIIGSKAGFISGTFYDGFGFKGTFKAHKVKV